MQVSDDLFLGAALLPNLSGDGNPAPMSQGVGPLGRSYVWDVVPAGLLATALAAAQAVAGAGNLTLSFGSGGVTRVTLPSGVFGYVLDCPRAVAVVSANAGDTTQLVTVSGFDLYGQPMSARVTLNGTTSVSTLKAFKIVTQIAVSAATAGNVSAGTNNVLGIPLRVNDRGYLDPKWASVLAQDGGTVAVADATSPATLLTGDVRGTYTPSSATDGAKRLVVNILLTGLHCGPNATRAGAVGVTQF